MACWYSKQIVSCQGLLLVCGLAHAWCSLFSVLPMSLSRVLIVLGVLSADLDESLKIEILLVLKADGESLKVIFFVVGIFVVSLLPCLC